MLSRGYLSIFSLAISHRPHDLQLCPALTNTPGFQQGCSSRGTVVVCRRADCRFLPQHKLPSNSEEGDKMMKLVKIFVVVLFATAVALPMWMATPVEGQDGVQEARALVGQEGAQEARTLVGQSAAPEALTTDMDAKTDDLFNGFGARGTPIDECVAEPEPPTARGNGRFEDNLFIFAERETIEDGLGPTYNDVGCSECHQFVDVGAFAQNMEFRAGRVSNGQFVDAPGGQLIHARATDSDIVEHTNTGQTVRAFRVVLSTLGDGFVECISNGTLQNNVAAQPFAQRGTLTNVPVVEANNALRVGRFSWKAQHASLVSFPGMPTLTRWAQQQV